MPALRARLYGQCNNVVFLHFLVFSLFIISLVGFGVCMQVFRRHLQANVALLAFIFVAVWWWTEVQVLGEVWARMSDAPTQLVRRDDFPSVPLSDGAHEPEVDANEEVAAENDPFRDRVDLGDRAT